MTSAERQAALERARQGDSAALGALLESFRPYAGMIARSLRDHRLRARVEESDLIQDALLEAHRSFAGFRGDTLAALTAWVRQIVIRTVRQTLRRHLDAGKRDAGRECPTDALDGLAADSGSTPSAEAIRHEEAARLAAALDRLPEDMRLVLLGRHVDGLSYGVLAERLGRSEGAVRVLYTRALRRLREECRER
jgi:RNA polymerase sigma-70 factor (ECF subfamily)